MSKKLKFEFQFFQHKWPVLAIGFIAREFVVVLWIADFRISWGY
jgi:hypothetical protein